MKTKFNIGDKVLIIGTVRRIEISREGEIYYDVDTEGSGIENYGFSRVCEDDIIKWREKEKESADLLLSIHHNTVSKDCKNGGKKNDSMY